MQRGKMVLAFEFHYISQNGILERLLKDIALDFSITHKIIKNGSIVTLFVEEESEKLGEFADVLSHSLPLSIFFKSSSVQVVEAIPQGEENLLPCTFPIEFTPKILSNLKDKNSPLYLNPFIVPSPSDALVLSQNGEELMRAKEADDFEKLYEQVAHFISEGENVEIKTKSGHYAFGKVENLLSLGLKDNFEVVATDMSVVERLAVIRDNEIKVLASLERPSIRVKVNAFYANKGILPTNRVKLRLAEELLIHLVCEKLFAKGVHFIFKTPSSSLTCKANVDFDKTIPLVEPLEVAVLENGEIVIVHGKTYASPKLVESLAKFEDYAHASFASIMQEHGLFDDKASCFYLSCTHDDRIMNYSKEHGMLDLTHFKLPSSFEAIFDEIEKSGKSGPKMMENYKNSFPDVFAHALSTKIPQNAPQSIYTLWKIVSIILGLSKDFESGAEILIENAENFGGKKGPRIDYFLLNEEALISDFNALKCIRSGMSFKLAGIDDTTISFGYMESLGYFFSDMADFYKENLHNQKIALGGSLFGYRRLTELSCQNIKPNHTICLNRELPIEA